jgi:hypothetical protein
MTSNVWLDDLIDRPGARRLLASYFDPEGPFAGDLFDHLGANNPSAFAADDLLAVTFLNVVVPPRAARAIIEAGAANDLLCAVPESVDLWEATNEDLGAAGALWTHLASDGKFDGVGEVTAGKLLARKRPRLVPIVDRVVRRVVPAAPGHYWEEIAAALQSEDQRTRLESLRPSGVTVTTLRLLDALMWMSEGESRNARDARGLRDDDGPAR